MANDGADQPEQPRGGGGEASKIPVNQTRIMHMQSTV